MPPRRFPFVAAAALLLVAILLLAGATAADAGRSGLASRFLEPHNAARRAVGLRPLRWDEGLAAYARRRGAATARWSTRTGPTGRTSSAGAAAPGGPPPTWWAPGSGSGRSTTRAPTPAAARPAPAATTRRSCGAARRRSGARSCPAAADAPRSGFAATTRPATTWASGPTDRSVEEACAIPGAPHASAMSRLDVERARVRIYAAAAAVCTNCGERLILRQIFYGDLEITVDPLVFFTVSSFFRIGSVIYKWINK